MRFAHGCPTEETIESARASLTEAANLEAENQNLRVQAETLRSIAKIRKEAQKARQKPVPKPVYLVPALILLIAAIPLFAFSLTVPAIVVLAAGLLRLDPGSYAVSYDGQPVSLTKKEFDLLRYLMQRKGQAVTRDALLSDVWGYDYAGDTNVVDVYIRYLRHKIDEPFGIKTIHTIRAVGYMFSHE